MKTKQEWEQLINNENIVPDNVIEEATHNPITEDQIKAIQIDTLMYAISVCDTARLEGHITHDILVNKIKQLS